METQRKRAKKAKAGIKDLLFIAITLFICIAFIRNFPLKPTLVSANEAIKTHVIVQTQIIRVPQIVKVPVALAKTDDRISKLRSYLQGKNSPLAPYSELIIAQADKYGIDWTKTVSIACMESACGTKLPDGSHNAWGLGGSRFMYFNTWEEGIDYVSALLGNQYKQNEYQAIKANYCPASDSCNPQWATIVAQNSKDILNIEQ